MNGFCGAQSLYASGKYLITGDPKHAWYALWFPFFGAIFDFLDGKIARWRNSSSMLGQELDSLADSISFGVAPSVAAFALGMRSQLDTLVLTLFVCAGVARLARFNITAASLPHDGTGKARYFEGLPIPSSLVLVIGMGFCLAFGCFETSTGPWNDAPRMFTGALGAYFNIAPGGGLPLGLFSFDASECLHRTLTLLGAERVFGHNAVYATANFFGTFEIHKISLLWIAWSMAMVSKTLRIPKP